MHDDAHATALDETSARAETTPHGGCPRAWPALQRAYRGSRETPPRAPSGIIEYALIDQVPHVGDIYLSDYELAAGSGGP